MRTTRWTCASETIMLHLHPRRCRLTLPFGTRFRQLYDGRPRTTPPSPLAFPRGGQPRVHLQFTTSLPVSLPSFFKPASSQMKARRGLFGLLRLRDLRRRLGRSRPLKLPHAVRAETAGGDGGAAPLAVEGVRVADDLEPAVPEEAPDVIGVHARAFAHLHEVGVGVLAKILLHLFKGLGILPLALGAQA